MVLRHGEIMVRFDKPCVVVAGAVEYFREHMAIGDYLAEDGAAELTWVGLGSARLGLTGRCQLEHFERVCRGLHPATGAKLMVRDKGVHRRVCFFGQISAPKDVSLLMLVGGDQRIAGWWQEAVAETLQEVEAITATRVRRSGANEDRATGNMVAAMVTHDASRSLDPQLHTHVCIMNLTYDGAEERWKSVQPSGFYRHQGYLREVCYNKLAGRLMAAGYVLEPLRGLGFNVRGVPAELREKFSKRRRAILARAKELGVATQDALQAIASDSRADKTVTTVAALRSRWEQEAGAALVALEETIAQADARPKETTPVSPRDTVRSAEAHVFERRSVVEDRVLLREALIAGRGRVSLSALKRAMAGSERTGGLLRMGDEIASREALESEREFVSWASAQLKGRTALGNASFMANLGPDQKSAARGVLGSTAGVMILQGDAGTGKTTCLSAIVAGIERAGGRVFGCAPSSGAAEVLRHGLTADAATLQRLLVDEEMQRQARDRVLIVDEAGLVSTREMRDLCRLAARNGNRLLLVGDIKQHYSVEAGDALRCLQEFARVPVFRLTEIRRQLDPAYRQAVACLARGDAYGAFKRFERLGAVQEEKSPAALFAAVAADYVRTVRAGKSCLAISPVWAEIHQFTHEVRRQLRGVNLLGRVEWSRVTVDSLKWTREECRRIANYQPGDVLTFHRDYGAFAKHDSATVVSRDRDALIVRRPNGREHSLDPRRATGYSVGLAREIPVAVGDRLLIRANCKPADLRNGEIVEVTGVDPHGAIRLKDGRTLPEWFQEYSHGYAATSHAAQGKTVDRGLLIMADDGIAAGNLKQAYVSNSRSRESQMIYTTDREAARDAMMRPSDRKLALEMSSSEAEAAGSRRIWRARWTALATQSARLAAA